MTQDAGGSEHLKGVRASPREEGNDGTARTWRADDGEVARGELTTVVGCHTLGKTLRIGASCDVSVGAHVLFTRPSTKNMLMT